jgi:hypothetical protein
MSTHPIRKFYSAPEGRPPHRITPYAEQLLARTAAHVSEAPPSEWITTTMAARLTNYSVRWIRGLCDKGFFVEDQDWKQRPPCPGFRNGGQIWIKRSALKKLEQTGSSSPQFKHCSQIARYE